MIPLDLNLIEQLLREEESSTLDFKRHQYDFEKADNKTKSELLKDILAFTNAWRRTTAYILIGVEEIKGSRSKVVGVSKDQDDANLQQFVNSKTQRPIEFSYRTFPIEGVKIGVIEIPVQERPVYLAKAFGSLDKEKVYLRRGSSTAEATPDEVKQMGAMQVSDATPHLVLEWADPNCRKIFSSPCTVRSLFLDPLLPDNTFEHPHPSTNDKDWRLNDYYSEEVIDFTFWTAFFRPIGLRLYNQSETVGHRVRFVGSLPKGSGICVRDWTDQPKRPYRNKMDGLVKSIVPLASQMQNNPDPCVRELDNRWEISIDFGDVRPRDQVWTTSPLLIGSVESGTTNLEGELRSDNIPKPISSTLKINHEVERRPMKRADVEQYLDTC